MNLLRTLSFICKHPLNQKARLAAVARFVRWQVGTRILPYATAVPFVNDFRLLAERGMTGATGNFYCGLHESADMAFVLHFLRPGDHFYDVGANVGTYSLLAAAAGVSQVHGFEPAEETYNRFIANIGINGLASIVTPHRLALGAASGEAKFSRGSDTTNHIVAAGEAVLEFELVKQCRLDDVFVSGAPTFLKLDVEGFEVAVLDGATAALQDPQMMGLLVEDDGYTKRYGEKRRAPALLAEYGFLPYAYDPLRRCLTPRTSETKGTNKLFLRDLSSASARVASAPMFRLVNGTI